MSTYRCPVCLVNWPPTREFTTCPECESKTDFITNDNPMDVKEALSRKRHADFEKFYAERSAKQAGDELEHLVRSDD